MAKILLVEDDNNLREIYEARLQAEGYDIVAAKDGEEALVVAKKEQPDLVISDVMMPRISGFEMLDIMRNTEGLKHVKVIMLTALGQAEDKTRADTLGADRYLVKSQVTLEDIVKSASDLLAGVPGSAAPAAAAPIAGTPPAAPSEPATPPPTMPVATPPAAAPAVPLTPAPVAGPAAAAIPSPAMPEPAVPATPAPTEPAVPPAAIPEPTTPVAPAPEPAEPVPAPATPAEPTIPAIPEPTVAPTPEPGAPPVPAAAPTEPAAPAPAEPTTPEPAAPEPAAPAAEPVAPAVPAPEPTVPMPEPAPAPAPAPAEPEEKPADDAAASNAAQNVDTERAAVQAQIDQFAAARAESTPQVPPPPSESDAMMADAVKDLVSGAPAPEGTVEPAAVTPTPAPAETPTPTPAPADDSVTISKKKIIKPLAPEEKDAPAPPNLHDLLAKEGMNLDDSQPAPTPGVATPGVATMPHQPGHVISPTPTNAQGQPIDPNSISL